MERERLGPPPLVVCIIGNPYNRKATEEATILLAENTGPMTSRGLNLVKNPSSAGICIVMDAPPKEFASYAASGQVILVTAQRRSKQSLNAYLAECKQQARPHWSNVKGVVNIDPEDRAILIQKWWKLNLTVFNMAEDYPLS